MALVRAYRLRCDRCYAGTAYRDTSREARQAAKVRGWKRIPKNGREGERGRDLCARCAESTEDGER